MSKDIKSFKEFIAEGFGLSKSDYTKIANAIIKDMKAEGTFKNVSVTDDEVLSETVGMFLENYPGAESATDKDILAIVKIIKTKAK